MKKAIKLLTLLSIFTVATTSLLAKSTLLRPACNGQSGWVCIQSTYNSGSCYKVGFPDFSCDLLY